MQLNERACAHRGNSFPGGCLGSPVSSAEYWTTRSEHMAIFLYLLYSMFAVESVIPAVWIFMQEPIAGNLNVFCAFSNLKSAKVI